MDRRDLRKIKVIPLKDNIESDNYFYELIVFTGGCKESGTHSNVIFILTHLMKFNEIKQNFFLTLKVRFKIDGDLNETGIRFLNEENKHVLQRSSIDTFIMAVKK